MNRSFKKGRGEWHFTIQIFTRSALSSVEWRCNGMSLINLSSTGENLKKLDMDLVIYDRTLSVQGYMTSFSTGQQSCSLSDYNICLTNIFGRRCEQIKVTLGKI